MAENQTERFVVLETDLGIVHDTLAWQNPDIICGRDREDRGDVGNGYQSLHQAKAAGKRPCSQCAGFCHVGEEPQPKVGQAVASLAEDMRAERKRLQEAIGDVAQYHKIIGTSLKSLEKNQAVIRTAVDDGHRRLDGAVETGNASLQRSLAGEIRWRDERNAVATFSYLVAGLLASVTPIFGLFRTPPPSSLLQQAGAPAIVPLARALTLAPVVVLIFIVMAVRELTRDGAWRVLPATSGRLRPDALSQLAETFLSSDKLIAGIFVMSYAVGFIGVVLLSELWMIVPILVVETSLVVLLWDMLVNYLDTARNIVYGVRYLGESLV